MFTLMASMLTGNTQIDAEHRELVEIINAIAEAERHRRGDDVMAALERFRDGLESHFRREEAHLETIRFPGLAAHAEHHAKTLSRLQEIEADFTARPGHPSDTATTCFDELLRAVLKQDLEVINWQADRRIRRK